MANEQNLRPCEYKLTREEQKKGGIASGKARRRRKTLLELGNMLGGLGVKSEKNRQILRDSGVIEEDMIADTEMLFALQAKAKKGDPRSIELLAKLRGQLREISENHNVEYKPLVDLTKRPKNGEGKKKQ